MFVELVGLFCDFPREDHSSMDNPKKPVGKPKHAMEAVHVSLVQPKSRETKLRVVVLSGI